MKIKLPLDAQPIFASEDNEYIDCDVFIDDQILRFTAAKNDPELHGQIIYQVLYDGHYGKVLPFENHPNFDV